MKAIDKVMEVIKDAAMEQLKKGIKNYYLLKIMFSYTLRGEKYYMPYTFDSNFPETGSKRLLELLNDVTDRINSVRIVEITPDFDI